MKRIAGRVALGALLLSAVVLAVTAAMTARAQTGVQLPRTGLVLGGITEQQVTVPNALLTRLRSTKQAANLGLVRNSYLVRNNKTFFRQANGQERQLLPLAAEAPPSQAVLSQSQVLPGVLSKYRNRILIGRIDPGLLVLKKVDHRSKQTPIKDQQGRGTCVCFASMAGLEVAYNSTTLDLSEHYANYLFMKAEGRSCKSDGLATHNSANYLAANSVCVESLCTYQYPIQSFCNGGNPATTRRAAIGSNAKYGISSYHKIWRNDSLTTDTGAWINNPAYLESILDSGRDIIFGTHVAGWTGNVTGLVDVVMSGGSPLPSVGGHAMLIVGYDKSKTTYPEEYFIVKNSWGTSCGQSGYIYLSYDYIRTYAKYGYYITGVKPV